MSRKKKTEKIKLVEAPARIQNWLIVITIIVGLIVWVSDSRNHDTEVLSESRINVVRESAEILREAEASASVARENIKTSIDLIQGDMSNLASDVSYLRGSFENQSADRWRLSMQIPFMAAFTAEVRKHLPGFDPPDPADFVREDSR